MTTKSHRDVLSKYVLSKRSGFSLIEMLLVVAIIGILIALLLPALAGARDSALKVSTSSMIADIANASQRFGNDNAGRSPGYFSQAQMGNADNLDIGMSAMENAMIDLGGTAVILGLQDEVAPNPDKGIIEIGPRTNTDPVTGAPRVVININNIGAEGAYYTPDPAFWKAQTHGPDPITHQQAGSAAGPGQGLMPDLLDAWGNPMLIWSQDTSARGSILVDSTANANNIYTQFARISSDGVDTPGATTGPAWFYFASNAAFLEASNFSSAGINMAADPTTGAASTIASGVDTAFDALQRIYTLASLLASPSAFLLDPSLDGLDDATFDEVFPELPRGRFIVHSAGSDGIYFSSQGNGWKENVNKSTGGYHINFGNNYIDQTDNRIIDQNGAFTNIDMLDSFDDILKGTK